MQVATIELINKCPLNCPSCFIKTGNSFDEKIVILPDFERIIEKMKGIEAITLTGGECFLLKNLPEYCDKCPVKPSIFTTGVVNHNLISKLEGKVKKIHVNIKYPNKLDDIWKGYKGAFEQALKFLDTCKQYSIPTVINWVVDKTNLLYLTDMVTLAVEHKSKILALPFIPYDKKYLKNIIPYRFYCNYFSKVKERQPLIMMGVECSLCRAGVTRMNINISGGVSSCIYLPKPIFGNIFKDDIDDIIYKMNEWREARGMCGCIAVSTYYPK